MYLLPSLHLEGLHLDWSPPPPLQALQGELRARAAKLPEELKLLLGVDLVAELFLQ